MKRLLLALFLIAALVIPSVGSFAEDAAVSTTETANPISITAKQGFLMTWDDATVKNLTTFEVVKTKKIESWGKWNALWAGWSLDAGFAYDASSVDTGALLLGRCFGTLADYVPLEFPLLDKITITIYPIGLYIEDLTDHPKLKGCSGGAIIKAEIKFG
jgi:hypothetical protein